MTKTCSVGDYHGHEGITYFIPTLNTHNYFMNEPLGNECGEQYRIAISL